MSPSTPDAPVTEVCTCEAKGWCDCLTRDSDAEWCHCAYCRQRIIATSIRGLRFRYGISLRAFIDYTQGAGAYDRALDSILAEMKERMQRGYSIGTAL